MLSTEPWGLKLIASPNHVQPSLLSVLSTEPWGLKHPNLGVSKKIEDTFSALDRAVGFETHHIDLPGNDILLSVLSTEPWGLKRGRGNTAHLEPPAFSALDRAVGFETDHRRHEMRRDSELSVLSTEPWGLKRFAFRPRFRR